MRRIDWNNTVQIDPEFRTEYGVVFACPFKERGGATVRDYSGNRYHGTLVNGPTRAFDKWGGPAMLFASASTQYVNDFDDATRLSFVQNTGVFTISLWAKLASLPNTTLAYLGSSPGRTADKGVAVYWDQAGGTSNIYCQAVRGTPGSPAWNVASTNNVVSDTNWHHVAVTGDGSTITLYIDGASNATASVTGLSSGNATQAVHIGRSNDSAAAYFPFDGTLAHVTIASKCADAAMIARLYRDPYAMYWQPSRKKTFILDAGTPAASRLLNLRRRCYA